uniref:Spermine synthase-like n=1 Tax=Phallusia mammillata TaxID=59560 RepID=A0A6F9DTE3_9ASCI|nr:spermine synthase-like [Phallusia mammillata]
MDSLLLEFWFDKELLDDSSKLDNFLCDLSKQLKSNFNNLSVLTEKKSDAKQCGFVMLYQMDSSCTILVQGTGQGLLTIDVHAFSEKTWFNEETVQELRNKIFEIKSIKQRKTMEFKSLLPIKRGRSFTPYDTLSTGYLVEYDFDELVFDQDSPYQNVRILHSNQFGNCLVLDNDINLAESDLAYTVAITGDNKEDYTGKDVLVLGGGDGGILNYLRDKGPSMITMIDIDRVVIDAAKIHLRGICGDSMDEEEGKNYKIIVDDCVKHLVEFTKAGRKFDYVINDLTAIPISKEPVGSHWDFLRLILSLSLDVLKDDGKYFTQGNGSLNIRNLKMYEDVLKSLKTPVNFSKQTVGVPSYMELWVFYTLRKTKDTA